MSELCIGLLTASVIILGFVVIVACLYAGERAGDRWAKKMCEREEQRAETHGNNGR